MRLIFYVSALLLMAFEILNVYFIMPMPGSQEIQSIELAYFLYSFRWWFRIVFGLLLLFSFYKTWPLRRKWLRVAMLIPVLLVIYLFNFMMVADKMFLQPSSLVMANTSDNKVPLDRLILGIAVGNEAKAYPIEFMAYHHQVRDKIAGKAILVSYCSVCRTGRIFEPLVDGKMEEFRLVGMDHFNAMFEDASTGSWWRQVNGEAIQGPLKGKKLPELISYQMTLSQWLQLYPHSLIMQPDEASMAHYDPEASFEKGESTGSLTGTNKDSWQKKSWVVGIEIGNQSKAYDWNELTKTRIINDTFENLPVVIVLATDNQSFSAFERPTAQPAQLRGDTLIIGNALYNFAGINLENPDQKLERIRDSQEFWHSWQTFHPNTAVYK